MTSRLPLALLLAAACGDSGDASTTSSASTGATQTTGAVTESSVTTPTTGATETTADTSGSGSQTGTTALTTDATTDATTATTTAVTATDGTSTGMSTGVECVCEPGSSNGCDPGGLLTCKEDCSGYEPVACPMGQKCMGDACVALLCVPDETVCEGVDKTKKCNADGDAFEPPVACGATQQCGSGVCIEVCELMPMHAKIADKYNIIRSIHHDFADHGGGHKRFLTGRIPATPVGTVNDAPAASSIVMRKLKRPSNGMPTCVSGVDSGRSGIDTFAFGPAYLGPSSTPFMVAGDPSAPDFQVQNIGLTPDMETRLEDRMHLLGGMDKLRRDADKSGLMGAMDQFSQRAFDMLTSDDVRNAFDLSKEPAKVRQRYGMHAYGQRGLMARRLVEGGARFVTMVWENPNPGRTGIPKNCCYNWDSHAVNCDMYADLRWRMPCYDQALTALIEDIHARGMEKDVMIVCTGEFGRTPKINQNEGRDHYPKAFSSILAGGGIRGGQIYGKTDKGGHEVVEDKVLVPDFNATIAYALGLPLDQVIFSPSKRPFTVADKGQPITQLFG